MKVARLRNLEKVVEGILRKSDLAREDDCYLILEVIREMYPFEVGKTFAQVMFSAKSKGISFESITRCRRKLQKEYPELKSREIDEQNEYIQYSREK